MIAGGVLRLERECDRHDGVFRQTIEQRKYLIPSLALCREMADVRRPPQALDAYYAMRHIVENPARRCLVRTGHRQGQLFRKVMTEWHVVITRVWRQLQKSVRITLC